MLAAGARETHLRARLSPVTPRVIASAAPLLSALSALDAPIGGEVTVDLDAGLTPRDASLRLNAGAGSVRIGASDVPFLDAALVASGTVDAIAVQALRVSLRGRDGGPVTHVEVRGSGQRRPDRISADLSADLDQVDFADLGRLWPEGIGGGARGWSASLATVTWTSAWRRRPIFRRCN
jgi:hypothetical protein